MGLLKVSASDEVVDFIEKPSDPAVIKKYQLTKAFYKEHKIADREKPHYLGSMGIYVFKREALFRLLREEGDDFGKDLIPLQLKKGKTSAFVYNGYWEDIGTVSSYYQANLALTEREHCLDTYDEKCPIYTHEHHLPSPLISDTKIRNSIIGQGSIIKADSIYHSIIGIRSEVGEGTQIADSIVMGNHFYTPPLHQSPPLPPQCRIGKNCLIKKAIIDEHTCLGDGVQLINKNRLETYDGNGIYIRDGIIIVTSGTTLADGFTL
jgi:glucose-1-phosphate adenylyltransferase